MNSPRPLINYCETDIDYDIVEEKILHTRIIVFIDIVYDELHVAYRENEVTVIVYSNNSFEKKTLFLKLKRKVKRVKYSVKNGILTLDINHKILPF